MAFGIPFKLLEINVISAQDLPPVSKMLRTFAVAWINPEHKLSTRIDHHGHTNPTWNYKLVFRVEDRFLRSERAAITIEIYNVAWLRDLPIGTAHLTINQISPPLVHNCPNMRNVALHICRPSGHLQGILNLGVNILDNGNPSNIPLPTPSEFRVANDQGILHEQKDDQVEENGKEDEAKMEPKDSGDVKRSSIDEKMKDFEETLNRAKAEGFLFDTTKLNEEPLEEKSGTKPLSSIGSMMSVMKPLPSEVVVNLKKGVYSTGGGDYGSSTFENWSEPITDDNRDGLSSRSIGWRIHDETQLTNDHENIKESKKSDQSSKRRHNSDGGSLFSCFGKSFEFTFICGSSSFRRNRKKKHQRHHYSYPEDDLRRFYP